MAPIAAVYGSESERESVASLADAFDDETLDSWAQTRRGNAAIAGATAGADADIDARPRTVDGLVVALDGRIDDRSALQRALPGVGTDCDDATLLARAYQTWGVDAFTRVVGPHATVLYDPAADRLCCARDPTGLRHLFYGEDDGTLVVATEPRPVAAHPTVAGAPEIGVLAEFLCGRLTAPTATFYDGVERLRPGHRVVATADGIGRERYWEYGVDDLSGASTERFAEALRTRLADAIGDRLPGDDAAAVMMSGGLDSTGIAAIAQRRSPKGASVPAVSVVLDALAGTNERRGIRAVSRAHNVPVELRRPSAIGPFDDPTLRDRLAPGTPCLDASLPIYESAFAGARDLDRPVLLTGLGGNLLDGDRSYYLDLLASGSIRRVAGELASRDLGATELLVYLSGILRDRTDALAECEALTHQPDRRLVPPGLARRTDLAARLRRRLDDGFDAYERTSLYRTLSDPQVDFARLVARRLARRAGIDQRHPFLDARVVDLAFSLPPGMRYRAGRSKRLYRTAMADLLPDVVRRQPTTANDYGAYVAASYARNADAIASYRADALDAADALSDRAAATLRAGADVSPDTAGVAWRVQCADRWLAAAGRPP